ncbi:TMEM65 domain-containing protein [Plasmodium yoelii yoelii]|uniref:TMEM65 domain-containing protein n=1 Tax=Plasmodium yoelii yoelii TaxID=73239 RepID=A0AAE9WQF0_PLAYO|nr:TMEM65 domain-containing protein [Plasmodium yoelii yoelii]
MYINNISCRSINNTNFLQQRKIKFSNIKNSVINYIIKKSLTYDNNFGHYYNLNELNNFKKSIKNMNSHNYLDNKIVCSIKNFLHLNRKYHVQRQHISTFIKKKYTLYLIKRRKKIIPNNCFKCEVHINNIFKLNSLPTCYNSKIFLQTNQTQLNTITNRDKIKNFKINMNKSYYYSTNIYDGINTHTFHTQNLIQHNNKFEIKKKLPKGRNINTAINYANRIQLLRRKTKKKKKKWLNKLVKKKNNSKIIKLQLNMRKRQNKKCLKNYPTNRKHNCEIYKNNVKNSKRPKWDNIQNPNNTFDFQNSQNVDQEYLNKTLQTANNSDRTNSDKTSYKKNNYLSKEFDSNNDEKTSHDKAEMNIKKHDLLLVALSGCIPFICFGFVDNAFMIISGDLFDSTFCVFLGLSTMAAAGLGNLTSDVLGIFIGGYIEKMIVCIGYPRINLTNKQLKMNITRKYYYLGSAVGIAIGCILGMLPLLFIDSKKLEEKKNKRKQNKKKEEEFQPSEKHTQEFHNDNKDLNKKLIEFVSKKLPQYINSSYAFLFIFDKNKNQFYTIINNNLIYIPITHDIISETYIKKQIVNYYNQNLTNIYTNTFDMNKQNDFQSEINKSNNSSDGHNFKISNINDVFFKHHGINANQVLTAPVFGINVTLKKKLIHINKYINFPNDQVRS